MDRDNELEFVRLAGAEIDDQALAEIAGLLGQVSGAEVTPARLIRLAASGPLIVARRPCGLLPEIVGVAGLSDDAQAESPEIVAVDAAHADRTLEQALRAALQAQRFSLFRRRDRAPLGFACAATA